MLLCFGVVVLILGKFGWPVITGMINKRGEQIEESIRKADEANSRLANTNAESERLLLESKNERIEMLKEASNEKDKIIAEAKVKAEEEAKKIIERANESIQLEKANAIKEIRQQVAELSVIVAERVVREKLSGDEAQIAMVNKLLDEVNVAKS